MVGVGVGAVGGLVAGAGVGLVVVLMVGGSPEWEEGVIDVCVRVAARFFGVTCGLLGAFVGSMMTWDATSKRFRG